MPYFTNFTYLEWMIKRFFCVLRKLDHDALETAAQYNYVTLKSNYQYKFRLSDMTRTLTS